MSLPRARVPGLHSLSVLVLKTTLSEGAIVYSFALESTEPVRPPHARSHLPSTHTSQPPHPQTGGTLRLHEWEGRYSDLLRQHTAQLSPWARRASAPFPGRCVLQDMVGEPANVRRRAAELVGYYAALLSPPNACDPQLAQKLGLDAAAQQKLAALAGGGVPEQPPPAPAPTPAKQEPALIRFGSGLGTFLGLSPASPSSVGTSSPAHPSAPPPSPEGGGGGEITEMAPSAEASAQAAAVNAAILATFAARKAAREAAGENSVGGGRAARAAAVAESEKEAERRAREPPPVAAAVAVEAV